MDPALPAVLTTFPEVMGWLRTRSRADPGFGRVELLSQANGAARAGARQVNQLGTPPGCSAGS